MAENKVVHAAQRAAFSVAIDAAIKAVRGKGTEHMAEEAVKLINLAEPLLSKRYKASAFDAARKFVQDPNGKWMEYAYRAINEIDPHILKMNVLNLGYEGMFSGYNYVMELRKKYDCNMPWILLFDPTASCNLHCKGCWAAEYGNRLNLTYEEMDSVVTQGKELGTYLYMFTGGEPLVRKSDIIKLCEKHNDCAFLSFTNGTLVDEEFCQEMKRVGNLYLAISLEGFEAVNDLRRGDGVYGKVMNAMDLLKKNGLVFGTSICYTSKNTETVTSDEFIRLMVDKGCRYAMYFHYIPVGNAASVELLPTPEQRIYMKDRIRQIRSLTTGQGLFTFDFQNDGEFVGGCIAGGRNYFHINANGDAEPCVFIHYSGANIRTNTLLEILHQPLFMAYRRNQPFNKNHLRPCPMLENPEILQRMVKETGAKSTDLESPESAEHLCSKCVPYANNWKPYADKIWSETPKIKRSYENYEKH